VVITGASRGLGFASATHLYNLGWRVVAAMRSPETGMKRLRSATGAGPNDRHLIPVTLDLDDPASIVSAAKAVGEGVGAPDAVVHNAGIAVLGCVEETTPEVVAQVFSTNVFGPMRLTAELLPLMRRAGRGRIVVVSSYGGIRGVPAAGVYSASKGALERWAEALAQEIAPFGLGVTVLVAGAFRTDLIDNTPNVGDQSGPYAAHYAALYRRGDGAVVRAAKPPERFAIDLAKALDEDAPFARHGVGLDARVLLALTRLLPGRVLHALGRVATGIPKTNAVRGHVPRSVDD
jgi:NAD(P)-dependent dehydrogenase (short-subunit alcohol dehydrogenase family)